MAIEGESITDTMVKPDCDRWKRTSLGSFGQHRGQAAIEWPKDRSGPLRSSQHLRQILPRKTYVHGDRVCHCHYDLNGHFWSNRSIVGGTLLTQAILLVNYLAYLRKMTRYNPTRGGTDTHLK